MSSESSIWGNQNPPATTDEQSESALTTAQIQLQNNSPQQPSVLTATTSGSSTNAFTAPEASPERQLARVQALAQRLSAAGINSQTRSQPAGSVEGNGSEATGGSEGLNLATQYCVHAQCSTNQHAQRYSVSQGLRIQSQNPLNPNPSVIVDGEINHFLRLSQDLAALYLNQELSDVTFVVGGERFVSHRVILASRSDYFRVLLFGSFREAQSSENEFVFEDTSALAFGALLKYIYTGKLAICEYTEPEVLEILGLAHKYRFELLEESIASYLKISLTVENVCLIYDDSLLYGLTTLTEICKEFLDSNASEVMEHRTFLNLSLNAICELIDRDSFYAPELEIFTAIFEWQKFNTSSVDDMSQESKNSQIERSKQVINKVRLTLISLKDLLDIVRPSGLFSAEEILDAIKVQSETSDINRKYRGCVSPNENVALSDKGATVIQGEIKDRLFDGVEGQYDYDISHNRYPVDDKEGIIVKLGKHYIINTIKLLLGDKDHRASSYYVEVSVDKKEWVRVCDYSNYSCRSWQLIHFEPRVVIYIRIVGVPNNSMNRSFQVNSIRCMYSTAVQKLNKDGFICPSENVASTKQFASVAEGVSRSRNALINGDTENYDWDMGYTCHQLGSGSIVIQLCQPFCLSSMRMLLWDCDARAYSYFIEVSNDQKYWTRICDRTKEDCRGWQYASFEPVVATFVKLVGTRNTANEVFHVVHFETPASTFTTEEEKRSLLAGEKNFMNVNPNPNL
ncbi:BTB/POZ domain-containing protein 9-like [Convolutriloba macropyga]|uniref:BTB/POZ domain-containing protein 9-like n=1 Tax=Convolutriloba macropyga TaxID=536237 RepID=UPI003F523954